MSEIADRYREIASTFTARVHEVPTDAWDRPAPCEGWVARDIIRHLVSWMPSMFLSSVDVPSADDDPAAAWDAVNDALQAALDDEATAGREIDMGGTKVPLAVAVDRFATADVLIHTWDLARATGLDERIDEGFAATVLDRMKQVGDERMRSSGQFGPAVEVPDDADVQTRLIAFTGRTP